MFLQVTGPLGVEGAIGVGAVVGVGAEVVAQALDQGGGQPIPAQPVVVRQRRREGRRRDAGRGGLRHDPPPAVEAIAHRGGEIRCDQQAGQRGIAEATFARSLSAHADQREAARKAFGTEVAPFALTGAGAFTEDVRRALYASKVVAYAQGFDHIAAGSAEYGWDIDRGAMATIWRGGCIIRARFLDRIREAYDGDPALPSLLVAPYFAAAVRDGLDSWRRVVAQAAAAGIPAPAFSASLAYYDGLRRERLPAALIQGLRDNFGAHTYHRVDADGAFHTEWAGDLKEHPA